MSRDIDDIALTLACPACKAEPGYWCVTYRPHTRPPGETAVWLHAPRTNAVREAWSLGYHDGNRSALESAVWHLNAARDGMWWAKSDGVPVLTNEQHEQIVAWLYRTADKWGSR